MRTILVLVAGLGAALVVGCGGGEEEAAPSPVATVGADVAGADLAPADLVASLPEVIVTEGDVPAGFVESRSGAVSNEAVAAGDPFPEERMQELEEVGRVGGYQVVFERDQGRLSFTLSVYETAEGAQRGLDMGVRYGPGVATTPIDAPDVGLPAAALEVEEQMEGGLEGYLMLARKGRINVSVSFGEVGGVESGDVEDLLRDQVARLGDLE